ncbi:MAG TPA: tetratricopeptide repeat protein [Granulicella sp.]|nr:tetratricopeptide repeat protein [Granulicella sp.]
MVYALIAGLKTVVDFDLGWQMASGRYLLSHHVIPRTELFSYTAHGVEWIYPVLSGVVFYLLDQLGGYAAISWLCALTCVGCAAVLVYRRSLWAIVLAVIAVPVLASETMPRASLFTMLLFACFARILIEHFEDRRGRLWLLPVFMLLWVNLHTGFIAGIALIAAYLLAEALETPFASRRAAAVIRLQRVWPWLIATVAVTILNPWGFRIFLAVSRQQAVTRWQSVFLEEWAPVQLASALHELNWRDPDSARWWLLAFGIVIALALLWRRRFGPALVLSAAVFAFLRHQRMEGPSILLICLIGGSVLSKLSLSKRFAAHTKPFAIAGLSLLTVLVVVRCRDLITNRTYLSSGEITLFGAGQSWWLPEKATDFLLRNHLAANVFSDFNLSSYLVWRLGEQYPDFADGRYVPFGEQIIEQQRALVARSLDSPQWAAAAQRYQINTVVFPLSRIYALGEFPLLADCESKSWTPVYMDTTAIIFRRNAPSLSPALAPVDCRTQDLIPSPPASPSSGRQRAEQYQMFANASAIYSALGRFQDADDAADRASSLNPNDPTLLFIRAQTALGERQYGVAEELLQSALVIRQTDAGWYNLGLLYIAERRLPEAVDALRRSADLSRENDERYLLIGRVQLAEQLPSLALDTFAQAARKSPYGGSNTAAANEFNAQVAEGRAAAYMQLQQPERAIQLQRLAAQMTPQNAKRRQVLAEDCQAAGLACAAP